GIELGGALKRADRLVVVEAVDERQTLIEEFLRLGAARLDRVVMVAKSGKQRGGLDGRRRWVRADEGGREQNRTEGHRDSQKLHPLPANVRACLLAEPCRSLQGSLGIA